MKRTRWWFKLILAGILALFVTTSVIPAFTPAAYAQGPFGNKRQGTTDSDSDKEKEKQEQERKEREAREKAEADRQAKEQAERDRQAREQTERDRQSREQAETQRQAREREEREKQAREQEEQQRRDREAREARERQEREQAEKQRQAQEQADRERREREAQAENDRQAREQAEQDRIAREQAEKDKQTQQPASVFNKSGQNETTKRTNEPIQPQTQHRTSGKYTRVEERPKREEPRNRDRYRPPDYYPYDPGYRRGQPDYYPVPIPEPLPEPEPIPVPQDDPEVIVIDRGPIPEPEPGNPDPEPEIDVPVQPEPEPLPDRKPEKRHDDKPDHPAPKPEKWAKRPEIPKDLKLQVKRGSGLEALNHISLGWLANDIKLVKGHVRTKTPVRIYKKGKYSHKLTGKEFIELTTDAMKRMNTREFRLKPVNTKNGKVYAQGSHIYVGLDGKLHKTLLNYTLKKVSGLWTVVEVGFSPGLAVTASR